jgi:transposase-like protein
MKRSEFTEAQIAFILRQGEEGTAVGEICRKAGISEGTYYNWSKEYGGLMPSEMKPLRQLEPRSRVFAPARVRNPSRSFQIATTGNNRLSDRGL